ncbi:MAG: hypothetical protein ABIO80_09445 [Sphingomicrobium sp.]
MITRQFIGDLALAVALVLPATALANAEPNLPQAAASSPAADKAAAVDRSFDQRGNGLFG